MIEKKLKCPKCGGVLLVKNTNDEESIIVTCPNCNAKIRATFDLAETQIVQPTKRNSVGSIKCNGCTYPLHTGKNILGRKAQNTSVDIPIETDDRSMSREHAQIEVVRLQNGRVKAILSDLRNRSKAEQKPILIECEPLDIVDRIVLSYGDTITLGNTNIKYVEE